MIRNRDVSRLEGLTDGVFAFAATLLVVSLEVPRSFEELTADLTGFVGFAVSFGALLAIWSVHHAYFRRYRIDDGWTIALNGMLLLVVLFYVYPLKFMTGGVLSELFPGLDDPFVIRGVDELARVFMLYSAGFVGVFLAFALLYRHAARRASMLELTPFALAEARFLHRHYLLFVCVGLFSILLAWFRIGVVIGAPGWIYFALGPLCFVHGNWSERELAPLRDSAPVQ